MSVICDDSKHFWEQVSVTEQQLRQVCVLHTQKLLKKPLPFKLLTCSNHSFIFDMMEYFLYILAKVSKPCCPICCIKEIFLKILSFNLTDTALHQTLVLA